MERGKSWIKGASHQNEDSFTIKMRVFETKQPNIEFEIKKVLCKYKHIIRIQCMKEIINKERKKYWWQLREIEHGLRMANFYGARIQKKVLKFSKLFAFYKN